MIEEKCFACDEKTKRKKRSRHWEMLSRVERDNGSVIFIDAMKKNEDLSDQWLHSATEWLKIMTSHVDVFTADVFYHQSCYNHFVYSYEEKTLSKKMYVFRVILVRILRISPHSVRMQENTDQKNFEYRRLLRSESTTKTEMTDEEISLLNNSTE